jgi:hypothetical protein
VTNLKTKESTLNALRRASRHPLTASEVEKQRVSFVMGSLRSESPMTRAKVQEILAEQEGRKAQR